MVRPTPGAGAGAGAGDLDTRGPPAPPPRTSFSLVLDNPYPTASHTLHIETHRDSSEPACFSHFVLHCLLLRCYIACRQVLEVVAGVKGVTDLEGAAEQIAKNTEAMFFPAA